MGALICSSASSDSLRIRIIVGVRPTAAPRSSIPRAPWRGVVRERDRDELRTSRPCPPPGTEERGAVSSLVGPSPVDADGGSVVFTSCSSRRRCSSYVVSSMLARLPAAGMGCLASSPSCPIYSLGSETRSRCMQCSLRLCRDDRRRAARPGGWQRLDRAQRVGRFVDNSTAWAIRQYGSGLSPELWAAGFHAGS